MRFYEIMINESEMDHLISDVADFVKSKTNNNVKSIEFDLFFELVRERNKTEHLNDTDLQLKSSSNACLQTSSRAHFSANSGVLE